VNALSTIAAAVTMALRGAQLNPAPASIQRCYVPPDYDTAATKELKLLVIAFDEDVDLNGPNSTRDGSDHGYSVKVAITKRVEAPDVTSEAALAELDALSDFREALIDFFKANTEMGNAALDSIKNSPAYDPATLDQKKVFVSVIALNYRTLR
jgi:hypothetical protein